MLNGSESTARDSIRQLGTVLHRHGERWQIQPTEDQNSWIAIERPETPVFRVLSAATLGELWKQLDQADQERT